VDIYTQKQKRWPRKLEFPQQWMSLRCTKLSSQRLSAPYWPKNPGHPGRLEMDNHMVLFSSLPLLWDWFLPVEETIKNVRIKTTTKIK